MKKLLFLSVFGILSFNLYSAQDSIGGSGGTMGKLFQCPGGDDDYIVEFYGTSGSFIDTLGFRCKSGQRFGSWGQRTSSTPFSISNPNGFNGLSGAAGPDDRGRNTIVQQITGLPCNDGLCKNAFACGNVFTESYKTGGSDDSVGPKQCLVCPSKEKLNGLFIKAGYWIDAISINCTAKNQ